MSGPAKRGAFILVEGVDRCGKTTQCQRLVESLTTLGHRAELQRFPDRTTTIGRLINDYLSNARNLDDHVIHLLFSANRWEKSQELKQKLESGVNLVVDRYSFSGACFSAAKGLDLQWCMAPEQGLLAPDVIIFLDMPVEEAAKRGDYGNERYENLEMQTKVRQRFHQVMTSEWKVVNAAQTIDQVADHVRSIAVEAVHNSGDRPLCTL